MHKIFLYFLLGHSIIKKSEIPKKGKDTDAVTEIIKLYKKSC